MGDRMRNMRFLKHFFRGYASVFDGFAHPRHYSASRGGFARDARNLREDFRVVGRNLKATLDREQADQR